jgi:HAD superfamily hydrolase (TIGR01509 family)
MDTCTATKTDADGKAKRAVAKVTQGNLKAVIFDVDGTLADTERDGHRIAFNRAFADFGLDWHWSAKQYGQLVQITGGKERIRHYAAAHAPEWLRTEGERWVEVLHRLKSDIYSNLVLADALPLRPGVARLIEEMRSAGIRLAIATTTTPSSLRALIRANFGHEACCVFEVIGAGDIVPRKKPAPDVYHWVLRELDLPAEDCLVVYDSPAGLAAARAAGLATVVTESAYTIGETFPGALSVVSDLGEPGQASRAVAGLPLSGDYVDLRQLRSWHSTLVPRPIVAH